LGITCIRKLNSDGTVSVWDNGSLGNYWSDYFSKYPDASEIGDTGIGDTPYVINDNNIDYFPLMYPVGVPEINLVCTDNGTFADSFPLNFIVNKPIKLASYSLDGAGNVTVSGNTTLTGMPAGVHTVTVYVTDVYGFEGVSNTVTFTTTEQPSSFPVVPIFLAVAAFAIIVAVLFLQKEVNV
jgi:hypothetical protein